MPHNAQVAPPAVRYRIFSSQRFILLNVLSARRRVALWGDRDPSMADLGRSCGRYADGPYSAPGDSQLQAGGTGETASYDLRRRNGLRCDGSGRHDGAGTAYRALQV